MKFRKFVAFVSLLAAASFAHAVNLSFSGNFTHDNDVQRFTFVVGDTSTVTLRSLSYAGGVNAAGDTIAGGGFDPILALFTASGTRIGEQDDGRCQLVPRDVQTGQCWDVSFNTALNTGSYIVTIQQYNNFSKGNLSAGFNYDGVQNQNFRNGFVDDLGSKRDSHWAFDILNVNSAAVLPPADVPEPASLAILAIGTAGMALSRRRRSK